MQNIADGLTQSVASDGQTPMSGALNMANNKAINVADPTNAQDAATKAYTDAAITTATSGLSATYLVKASNLSDVANATTSRTNLSAAKSGANSDITSITGLTTALTVAQGGTSATTLTANSVLLGNGTSALQTVAPSTSGNVLTSNGTTWQSTANNGTAKAWLNWNGVPTTSIRASYNVSSLTRTAQGTYTIAFTNALTDANYAFVGMSIYNSAGRLQVVSQDYRTANTASNCYVVTGYSGGDTSSGFLNDAETACIAFYR
jgi:hypothetical protein